MVKTQQKTITKAQVQFIGGLLVAVSILSIVQQQLHIKVDASTMLALTIGILLYSFPQLISLLKVKVGDVEVSVKKELDSLEELVTNEENNLTTTTTTQTPHQQADSFNTYYNDFQSIYTSSSSNFEKALRAYQLVEHVAADIAIKLNLNTAKAGNTRMILHDMAKRGSIPSNEYDMFLEINNLRNQIVHGNFQLVLDDSTTARYLDLTWRFIRILSDFNNYASS